MAGVRSLPTLLIGTYHKKLSGGGLGTSFGGSGKTGIGVMTYLLRCSNKWTATSSL